MQIQVSVETALIHIHECGIGHEADERVAPCNVVGNLETSRKAGRVVFKGAALLVTIVGVIITRDSDTRRMPGRSDIAADGKPAELGGAQAGAAVTGASLKDSPSALAAGIASSVAPRKKNNVFISWFRFHWTGATQNTRIRCIE